jgi:hypothetical protein
MGKNQKFAIFAKNRPKNRKSRRKVAIFATQMLKAPDFLRFSQKVFSELLIFAKSFWLFS